MKPEQSCYWIDQFLDYFQAIKERSPNTIKEYRYDLVLFLRFVLRRRGLIDMSVEFENISITQVDEEFLKSIKLTEMYAFVSWLSTERKNSPNARARRISSIRSFFNYLKNKARILEENPAADLESPKLVKKLPRHLTLDESQQLLAKAAANPSEWSSRDYCIITLFLNCGLRLSELCSIDIDNIKEDTLTVIGKGAKERTVYLNSACLSALNDYLEDRPQVEGSHARALFLSRLKRRISPKTVQWTIKNYIISIGLDPKRYSVHKLRHTAATLMYKYGKVDIRALQAILGHSSISTTEIYTHIDQDALHNAVESNPLSKIRKEK
ncbi:MAG: tyrosine recombinase XerC [Eubacteriales bacterium]|jgi:site-specific recombinase XerD|nr:tyrosine recombinase XerC [Eubacteriales bacterium]MDD3198090.1 tyrosine recombinase XerC [Eubacteriales bacterium]MDD4681621.1 tyrosine recombinase XerC [Eubacteriales bacterium]